MQKTDIINYNWHMCLDLRFFFWYWLNHQICISNIDSLTNVYNEGELVYKSFIKIMKYALG